MEVRIIFLKLNLENKLSFFKNLHMNNNKKRLIFNKYKKIRNSKKKKIVGVNIELFKIQLIKKEIICKINFRQFQKINKKLLYLMMIYNFNLIKIVKVKPFQPQTRIIRFQINRNYQEIINFSKVKQFISKNI